MSLKTEGCGTRQVPEPTRKIRKLAAFVKSAMLLDECSLTLKAGLLVACIIVSVDPVEDFAAITDDFSDDIAFEGIGFTDWMMPASFSLVFQCSPVKTLSNVKRLPTRPAEDVNVVSACYCTQIGIQSRTIAFKFHMSPLQMIRPLLLWSVAVVFGFGMSEKDFYFSAT